MTLIRQGLNTLGEIPPPLFDSLGEGADEKEVAALEFSVTSGPSAGGQKKKGGGGKVRPSYNIHVFLHTIQDNLLHSEG